MKKLRVLFAILTIAAVLGIAAGVSADGYCNCNCYPYNYNCGCCGSSYSYGTITPTLCATFVSDVTIADGSYVQPGQSFVKTWRIRNSGTATWTTAYRLVFVSGDQLGAPSSVALPYNVAPGQTVDISVQMVSPSQSGSYKGNWMLQSDTGQRFGVGYNCSTNVWVQIVNYVQNYNYRPGPAVIQPWEPWEGGRPDCPPGPRPGQRPGPLPGPRPGPWPRH